MTKSIAEIETKIEELRKKSSVAVDIGNELRVSYLYGMEEALMWVIGKWSNGELENSAT